jgi:CBS domain-containing membrane protein
MKVETIMSQNVIALQPGDQLSTAMDQMQKKRIRHLPIVSKKGEFLGLITHRDLLAASASFLDKNYAASKQNILETTLVAELMHKRVETTTPDADVREVAEIMIKNKYGCLPVLKGKTLAGIVTATDFITLAINLLSLHEQLQRSLNQSKLKKKIGGK